MSEECEDKHWLNSHGHTCAKIATDQWAQPDWTDTNGVRADEACCHFGGGVEPGCEDKPWLNGHGHTCADIATDQWARPDWTDTNGVRADEACCKFGGGEKGCVDAHWLNGHGHTCADIATDLHAQGDWTDTNGVRADEACCHFGGGDNGEEPEEPKCEDLMWLNSFGHTCADIATDPHAQGDWTDTNGMRADEACCKFGGGMRENWEFDPWM